jgi:hypothetical protein
VLYHNDQLRTSITIQTYACDNNYIMNFTFPHYDGGIHMHQHTPFVSIGAIITHML